MREAFRPRFFVELLRAVARLALPAQEQVAYLERIGTAPLADELALEFDESLRLVPQFQELGWLAADEVAMLEAINVALSEVSDDQWEVDALPTAEEWEAVRARAREFLFRQGHVVRISQ